MRRTSKAGDLVRHLSRARRRWLAGALAWTLALSVGCPSRDEPQQAAPTSPSGPPTPAATPARSAPPPAQAETAVVGWRRPEGLTNEQSSWWQAQTEAGWLVTPPVKVRFISLTNPMQLFEGPDLTKVKASLPAVPMAAATGGDFGANFVELTFHRQQGAAWEVELQGRRGWLRRGDIRADTLVLLQADGRYVRDLFLSDCQAGGMRCRVHLVAQDGRLVTMVRFVETYMEDGARWFAFVYDPTTDKLEGRLEPTPEPRPVRRLGDLLDDAAMNRLTAVLGFGRSGFISPRPGELRERSMFTSPLTEARPAACAGEWCLFDSRF